MARPRDEVRMKFENILRESNAHEKFKQILAQSKKDENFLKAYEMCVDRAYGKIPQNVDMNFNDTTDRPNREELEQALNGLTNGKNGNSEGTGLVEGK